MGPIDHTDGGSDAPVRPTAPAPVLGPARVTGYEPLPADTWAPAGDAAHRRYTRRLRAPRHKPRNRDSLFIVVLLAKAPPPGDPATAGRRACLRAHVTYVKTYGGSLCGDTPPSRLLAARRRDPPVDQRLGQCTDGQAPRGSSVIRSRRERPRPPQRGQRLAFAHASRLRVAPLSSSLRCGPHPPRTHRLVSVSLSYEDAIPACGAAVRAAGRAGATFPSGAAGLTSVVSVPE